MISKEGLQKFMDMYEQKYSVKLTQQEAYNLASGLINLVRITYEPIKKD